MRDLHDENDKILVDRDLCRDEIVKAKVYPHMDTVNFHLEKASEGLKSVDSIMEEYGLAFGEANGWGRFVSCSSWIGLRVIPRLSQACDKVGEDFWNITEATLKKQQKQREEAYKLSQHTPSPEA